MKKRKIILVLLATIGLAACAPLQSDYEEKYAVGSDTKSEVYVKKIAIGQHEFFMVYTTCDGQPGHLVKNCPHNHCFLLHSPDCSCHKAQMSQDVITVYDDTENTDPFDW